MDKFILIILSISVIVISCNQTGINDKNDLNSQAMEADTVLATIDTLSSQFEEVKSITDKIIADFERTRNDFYEISFEFSGEYDGGYKSWYFSPSFELLYSKNHVTVEGGEDLFDFYAKDKTGMLLEYHKDLIGSDIDEKIWVKGRNKYFERRGNMEENRFKYSSYETTEPSMYSYEEVFSEIPVDYSEFKYNNSYVFSISKSVESEYGEVLVTKMVSIDSLLFVHLFGNKITEKAN